MDKYTKFMDNYIIKKLEHTKYAVIIIPTSHINPLSSIENITEIIKSYINSTSFNSTSFVLFDYLLSRGNDATRFMEILFNQSFLIGSITSVGFNIHHPIRKIVIDMVKLNPKILDNSILNRQQKKLIISGISI